MIMMRVVVTTSEVIVYDLFNQKEADYAGNDNSIYSHLSRIVRVPTVLTASMVMPVAVTMMSMMIMTAHPI